MKQKGIVLAVVLGVTASLIAGCGDKGPGEQKPSTMPPDVAAEMQKRLGTTTGPGEKTEATSKLDSKSDAPKPDAPKSGAPKTEAPK